VSPRTAFRAVLAVVSAVMLMMPVRAADPKYTPKLNTWLIPKRRKPYRRLSLLGELGLQTSHTATKKSK